VAAAERGRVTEGLELIREACAADPGDAEAHAQLARWLSKLHRAVEALAAVEQALRMQPTAARTLDTIGVVLSRAGLHQRAVDCFERATSSQPGSASLHFNLAASLKFLGRFAAAERAYEACLRCDPEFWRAYSALAHVRTQTTEHNHVGRLAALLGTGTRTPDAELHLRHALAKELEDLGRYAESFEQLERGKLRKRRTLDYSFARDEALFAATLRLFGTEALAPPLPAATANIDPAHAPIFVVGMPRTGTTLVERILSSHAQVASVGESQNFGVLLKRATGTPSARVLDEATLARSVAVDLEAVGAAYLQQTRPAASSKPRFVDKMPLNYFYLGHIARALPGARFVVLRRHPLDTCLSNFRQLFALGFSYYEYAYDLLDTGRYYVMFDRLIAHWQQVLPGRILQLRYESLVTDQRKETARLLEHCNLEWDERCLDFERNPQAVATASAVQVRQPLYTSGVGRWRHFASQLQPVTELLRTAGIATG
jgi:tetratricopeptide (TPR) repeat protein